MTGQTFTVLLQQRTAGHLHTRLLAVQVGDFVGARFVLTLKAEGSEAHWTAGRRRTAVGLPVYIRGVRDNGCLTFFERKRNHFVFGHAPGRSALFPVAIDEGVDVGCGNVSVSDCSELRLTVIGTDEDAPNWKSVARPIGR